jgi:hypothetical protein
MSTQGVESVLSRAMSDPAFADLLFSDPEKALATLAGFELTAEEIARFKKMSRAEFDEILTPEERKSMAAKDIGNVKY